MAETFLFNIAERVMEKLANLSVEEAHLAFNVDNNDLSKLKETMSSIKAVLLDAERQQHQNEKLRLCMWKLRDIFYDAEDVIDDFKCEALRKQVTNHPNFSFKVRFLASCSAPLGFSSTMGCKIKEINHRLDELKAKWSSFNLGQCTDKRRVIHRETHSFVNSSDVIGRDEDKENIIDLLMKPGEGRNIPVVPIVGIGGLGKTTLAQLVYNDDRVTRSFPLKIWICVSDEFDLPKLLKLIIKSINIGEKCDDLSLEVLHTCLRRLLNNKKFILVLDNLWSKDRARWIGLKDLLTSMGGLSQSKIIVTTRSSMVVSVTSSIPLYKLKGLPLEDCLTLFAKWAFNDGDERQHPNLMRIGEDIVKKCKGVPLAVRTLGSLLFSKTDESDWVSLRDSEIWRLEQSDNDILPVLKLSYNHLPSHLQRCLAFLSLYKKEKIYRSDEVIQIWMANGLLEHPKQKQAWEDIGDRYLNELLSRCLIEKEVDKYGIFGFTFKMHDLIHDLALDVSRRECKTMTCQTETVEENVRHLSFADDVLLKVPQELKILKSVRTVIVQEGSSKSKGFGKSVIDLCVSSFKYLRALDLQSSGLRALPNSIGNLKHLRDLDFSNNRSIKKLPSSFYKLRSLQRLSMRYVSLIELPDSVLSLIELRYLEITIEAKHMKEIRQGCWPSLQYLGLFDCFKLECLPEGMHNLTSLRRLVLADCYDLVSLPRSLKFLSKLEGVFIYRCFKINLEMEAKEEEDKDLQFSLKSFSINGSYALTDLPQLLLEGSSSTLQHIRIEYCPKLVVLPAWLQNLTSLHTLEIIDCSVLSNRCRRDEGADWHKIAHIKEVVITGNALINTDS